jgi:hypothetical protein
VIMLSGARQRRWQALSSASWRMRMIIDGRGGTKVRCRESRQDRRPGEFEESSACELARRVGVES